MGSALGLSIRSSPPVVFALKSRRFVRSYPKKVEKTSSENTTFENSEHPYRTCGSLGGLFCFSVPPLRQFCFLKPIIPLRAVPKKLKQTSSENTTFDHSEHPYRTCGSSVCVFFLFGSSPMSVVLWKTNDFLKILVQIFENQWFSYIIIEIFQVQMKNRWCLNIITQIYDF